MTPEKLNALHSQIENKYPNICQAVALKNGKTVYDDCWNGFKRDNTLNVMSVTKSVVSLLIGIAIDKGLIKSIEQPVIEFFPEYKIKRGEKTVSCVTIRHLLTMTAPYKYKSEPWTKVCGSDDWTFAVLDLLGGRAGITGDFRYTTLGIHILTGIISKVCGCSATYFADKYLFEPLGIPQHRPFHVNSKDEHIAFITSKEPKSELWFADPQNVPAAGFGLCLSATDMSKLGLLCLNRGIYDNKRIVSEKWIDEISCPRFNCGKAFGNMYYGFLWWIIDKEKHIYAAIGDGGNVIYINPSADTVIAITSTFKPRVFDRIEMIQNEIEPIL